MNILGNLIHFFLECEPSRFLKVTPKKEGIQLETNQVSLTAIMTAYIRAYHAMNDVPKIFDDFLAYRLIPEERRTLIEQGFTTALQLNNSERTADPATEIRSLLQTMGLPQVLGRSRYTEDKLELAPQLGVRQYVILGAGLDTFAYRRPDLVEQLQVFEIDHPATQTFKRDRVAELNWIIHSNLHFVAVDFTNESLAEGLKRASFDPQAKSFFSWLGVTMYLTKADVLKTFRSISDVAPVGSTVVFDYFSSPQLQEIQENLRKIGEPIKTAFDPSTLAFDLATVGLQLQENVNPADIQERYFQGRTDGYHASKHVHFACAVVK